MTEFNYKYKDTAERAEKITEAEGQGLRMLHDNFDPGWKRGDDPSGTMIFTDEPSPVEPEPEPVMDYKAEILKLQDEVRKLKDKG